MMRSSWPPLAVAAALLSLPLPSPYAVEQTVGARLATPLEPIDAILDAFNTHDVVALGEGVHGNEQAHSFRLSLLRHPRFAGTVNDVVVEFGSARYQEVMDRFVRGEDVPAALLRRVWQDTTMPDAVWDAPIYEEFYRAVRAVNATLPRARQLRVLLGDPPIDWDTVRTADDVGSAIGQRDAHAAALIRREVLAKKRRALVIYGDMHFRRKRSPGGAPHDGVVGLLETPSSKKVFSIWTNTLMDLSDVQPNVGSWPVPSLALVAGTLLGVTPFDTYAAEAMGFAPAPGQASAPAPKPPPGVAMQEQFDAILYLGAVSALTVSQLSPELCADADYVKMRSARMALMPDAPGPHHPAERFKRECAERRAK